MFLFNELKSIHVEITTRCQASCPMCSRNYRGAQDNPNLVIADWDTQEFAHMIPPSVLKQLEGLYFCGNFGDPIINNHLLTMCEYVKYYNPNIVLRIHTNGGARTTLWWQELVTVLPKNHVVIFGIDGLEDTHHIYRIGTTYENVTRNAKAFIDAGGTAEWVFIKFKHNEHQVDEARERAKELGFARFTVKNSTRFMEPKFAVLDDRGQVEYYLEPPSDNQVTLIDATMIGKFRSWMVDTTINCYVQENKEIYIDAHKNMFPCCFLASTPYNYIEPGAVVSPVKEEILEQYHTLVADLGSLNLMERNIQEIIDSSEWQTVWAKYWNDKKLITCARTCGTTPISKPKDQFVERISFE
jgi:MoaA/NifB/PqqE/SkfB family radical SAM enzyme